MVTAASAGLGAGLGPVIMGGVLSAHGWRAVFWLTGALCLLALVLVLASTRGASTRFPARFDLPGAVVLAAALTVLLLGITNGAGWGWTSPRIVALVAGAGAMAAWWVRWERSRLEPLVDLAVSTSRPVLIAHLGGVMVGCATFAQFISSFTLVSLPVGHGLGRSLAVAGLVQLPGAAVLFGAVLLATRISATRGSYALLRAGAALIVAGFALAFVRHGSVVEIAQRRGGERRPGLGVLRPAHPHHGARRPQPDRRRQRPERPGQSDRLGAVLGDRHRGHGLRGGARRGAGSGPRSGRSSLRTR